MRHCKASIRLPCSKRVKLQVMISPLAARLASFSRTAASGMPVSLAISKSRHCPCFFKHSSTCVTATLSPKGLYSTLLAFPSPRCLHRQYHHMHALHL